MSFELINESFIFQNFMNDTLMNYLKIHNRIFERYHRL
jgi:hypothetical protein